MSNPNGKWEFDDRGNCHYVPRGGQPNGSRQTAGSQPDQRTQWHETQRYYTQNSRRETSGLIDTFRHNGIWQLVGIILGIISGAWFVSVAILILRAAGVLDDRTRTTKSTVSQQHYTTAYAQGTSTGQAQSTQNGSGSYRTSGYRPGNNVRVPEEFQNRNAQRRAKQADQAQSGQQSAVSDAGGKNYAPYKPPKKEKNRRLGHIGLYRGVGISLTALFGLCSIMELSDIIASPASFTSELSSLVVLLCFLAAGISLWGIAGSRSRKAKRYARYLTLIGSHDRVSVTALSHTTGYQEKKVRDDLQDMLDKGYFETGYLDMKRDELVLSGWNPDMEADQELPLTEAAADENTAVRTIRQIRALNNDIADPEMSEKIDRIEALTGRIFRLLEEHPEKESELRGFTTYYLPETLSLLDRYAKLEAQNVDGGSMAESMTQIEEMMDKIADGFEAQLDKMFESDAMDISADLRVMEQMLQKDGLTADEQTLKL